MMVPIIRVKDKYTGKTHIVGSNQHDRLVKGRHGLEYLNIQCHDGTEDGYEFDMEEYDDGFGGAEYQVEMIPVEEAIKLWTNMEREKKENELRLKEMLAFMNGSDVKDIAIMS